MSRVLRPEQKEAIYSLVHERDLLAVLPTGFGKSLIFQLLINVKQILSSKAACVIVVCPLNVQDQLTEASLMAPSGHLNQTGQCILISAINNLFENLASSSGFLASNILSHFR